MTPSISTPIVTRLPTLLCLAALILTFNGCVLELIGGPTVVTTGTFVEYEFRLSEPEAEEITASAGIVARIPEEWELVGSAFVASIQGESVTGMGSLSALSCPPNPPPIGYKYVSADARSLEALGSSDTALAALRFSVQGPPGDHTLRFTAIGFTGLGGGCYSEILVPITVQEDAPFFASDFETGDTSEWAP